jgi:hypothetical protein
MIRGRFRGAGAPLTVQELHWRQGGRKGKTRRKERGVEMEEE